NYPLDSIMRIELYLLMEYPKPLVFYAKLLAQESVNGSYNSRFELQGLDTASSDMLEKLLFRHHRRQIANSRHKKS
ncbi:MAG: PilZ domain-containing protein, partial [Gammaproteobacteria bacterium]|nr:PilZ domain-containing protein [Gammaproteobacteria bacterium]